MENTKVLVVDDAYFMRRLLGNTLKEIGYGQVFFAESGEQAIEKAKELLPHIVTLDITMQGMDGLETVSKILEVSASTAVIMVSAITADSIIDEAIRNGAAGYIKKPFCRRDIEEGLKRYTGEIT